MHIKHGFCGGFSSLYLMVCSTTRGIKGSASPKVRRELIRILVSLSYTIKARWLYYLLLSGGRITQVISCETAPNHSIGRSRASRLSPQFLTRTPDWANHTIAVVYRRWEGFKHFMCSHVDYMIDEHRGCVCSPYAAPYSP